MLSLVRSNLPQYRHWPAFALETGGMVKRDDTSDDDDSAAASRLSVINSILGQQGNNNGNAPAAVDSAAAVPQTVHHTVIIATTTTHQNAVQAGNSIVTSVIGIGASAVNSELVLPKRLYLMVSTLVLVLLVLVRPSFPTVFKVFLLFI